MNKYIAVGICASLCTAAICTGCASNVDEPTAPAQTEATATQAPALAQVGTPADGAYEIKLTNGLTDAITSISIVPASDSAATPTTAPCTFAAKETVQFYYTAPKGAAETDAYTVTVATKQGTSLVFTGVTLGAMKEATLVAEGDLNYVTYVDKSGAAKSTKEAVEAERAAAAKATEEQQAAEAAAAEAAQQAAAAEAEQPAADFGYTSTYSDAPAASTSEPTYQAPAYEAPSVPSYSYEDTSSSNASQTQDSCGNNQVILR